MNETPKNEATTEPIPANPYPVTVAVPSSEKYSYTRGTKWLIAVTALAIGAALAGVITFLAVGWSDSVAANRYKVSQIDKLQAEYKDLYNEFIQTTKQQPDSPSPAQIEKSVAQPGPRGLQGPQGPSGIDGLPGYPGLPGAAGVAGQPGIDGKDGSDGPPGRDGVDGQPGPAGAQGVQGIQGEKGDKGDTGTPGAQGPAGPSCPDGMTLKSITVTTLSEGAQTFYACQ